MSAPLRRAGRGRLPDGSVLTWSVAAGGRGRRWRASVVDRDGLRVGLLLEVGEDGRPTRLELTSADGLLTLHPEPDQRSLHGNVVRADGIDHLALPWSPEHDLLAVGVPPMLAVVGHRVGDAVPAGEGSERPAVIVDAALRCTVGTYRLQRLADGVWRAVLPGGATLDIEIDADGLPAGAGVEGGWPLERSEQRDGPP